MVGLGELRVEARRSMPILALSRLGCERRASRTAVPSSPAPTMRMDGGDIFIEGWMLGNGDVDECQTNRKTEWF